MLKRQLLKKYGPILTVADLAGLLRLSKDTIYNKISNNTLEVDTYKIGGKRVADTEVVAEYLEQQKVLAKHDA